MTSSEIAAAHLASALAVACVTGALARRRVRRAVLFFVYLATIPFHLMLTVWWPGRFYNWRFWMLVELTQAFLTLATSVEISGRIFRALPRALAAARRLLLTVLVGSWLVVVAGLPATDTALHDLALLLIPRLWYGALCAHLGVLLCAAYYSLPTDEWHDTIVVGFVMYLLLYALSLQLLHYEGWGMRQAVSQATQWGFVLTLAFWTMRAWSADRPMPERLLPLLRRTQPWRFS